MRFSRRARGTTPRRGTSRPFRARRSANSIRISIPAAGASTSRGRRGRSGSATNWRVNNQLTINYGVRWDDDWGVASPPDVVTNTILINNNAAVAAASNPGMTGSDFGYKDGIRDNRNVAPRAGFTYNVGGQNDLVIRGGSGLYFTTPVSNMTFSPQLYSQMVTAAFLPPASGRCADGSLFITNPSCGVTTFDQAKSVAPPQSPRIISPDYRNPYTWQSSIGFQKQLNQGTGFEADLTHFNEYHDARTIDPNRFLNPATGYNLNA